MHLNFSAAIQKLLWIKTEKPIKSTRVNNVNYYYRSGFFMRVGNELMFSERNEQISLEIVHAVRMDFHMEIPK